MTLEETQDKLQANIFKGWKVSARLRVAHWTARLMTWVAIGRLRRSKFRAFSSTWDW